MNSVAFTTFQNVGARTAEPVKEDWPAFVGRFKNPKEYRDKKAMPLLSFCEYGKKRSKQDSLRHSGNIKAVHGIEIDYDGEKVSPENARKRLAKAGVKAVIYTTPSHKPNKPRWRALLPLSKPVSADERHRLVGKANRALRGIATRESFSQSQCFYFGKVRKDKGYKCYTTEGKCVDRVKLKPLGPPTSKGGTGGAFDDIPDDKFVEAFEKGEGRYNAALALSARWIAKGRDPENVRAELHKHVRLAEHDGVDPHTTQGENLYKAINRLVDSAYEKYGKEAAKRKKAKKAKERTKPTHDDLSDAAIQDEFEWMDITEVQATEPKPQEFLIDEWFAFPHVAMLTGHGGSGKSSVAIEMAVCVAAGVSVFGRDVKQGRVLYVSSEDNEDVLNRRVSAIRKALDIPEKTKPLKGKLIICDATQHDTLLVRPPSKFGGSLRITIRYKRLRRYIRKLEPVLVVLDSAVDHYSGNENDRHQVRTFIRKLYKLTNYGKGCSILVLAHVDAGSVKDGDKAKGFSGSTAWHNAVHGGLMYLVPRRDNNGDPIRGERILHLKKSNHSEPSQRAEITWNEASGKFDLGKTLSSSGAVNRCAFRILRVVETLDADPKEMLYGESVSKGSITAKVWAHPDCPREIMDLGEKKGKATIRQIIKQLRNDGSLVEVEKRDPKGRHGGKKVLTLSDSGRSVAANEQEDE